MQHKINKTLNLYIYKIVLVRWVAGMSQSSPRLFMFMLATLFETYRSNR